MRYVWEKEDIRCGVTYHRGIDLSINSIPTDGEIQYAGSCVHKIGYMDGSEPNYRKNKEGVETFMTISNLTDGMILGPYTAEEMCEDLNDGGYKKSTREELIMILRGKVK